MRWLKRQFYFKNIEAIEFALQNGLYDVRKASAEYLGENDCGSAIPLLVKALDDEVQVVSESVMKALESLSDSEEIKAKIESKKEFWVKRAEEAESKLVTEKLYQRERKERPSKKTYENIKQMLRKPMNSGKWF